jgi:hypothetical protein
MPRYFFHCNGSDDTEGLNDATAREQAREAFGALIQQGDDCPEMEVGRRGRPARREAEVPRRAVMFVPKLTRRKATGPRLLQNGAPVAESLAPSGRCG